MKTPALALALSIATIAAPTAQPGTRLVILGSGTPNADPDRFGPAVAVVAGDASYLFDAGVGVVRRAAAAERSGIAALAAPALKRVFITHLHSDHTLGLADLIFSPWVLDRDRPLEVYGPRGVRAMVDHLQAAFAEDVRVRSRGGEPAHRQDPTGTHVQEITAGVVYRDERAVISAFPVKHGAWEQAFGYRIETADRTIVISGDTGPDSRMEDQCRHCDVLVHEVYSEAGFAKRPPEWQAYHARYHTSTRELAAIAKRARPKLLVLYHQLIWSSTEDALLAEIRASYDGRVVSAKDLDVF